MKKVRMFNIIGLLGGVPFGFSIGMNELTAEANRIEGVSATTDGDGLNPVWGVVYDLYQACLAAHASGRAIVLVGHSYGGYAAIVIAGMLAKAGVKVDLLVLVDTTVDSPLVPDTGGKRIEFYQTNDLMGRGHPASVPGAADGPIEVHYETNTNHVLIARERDVHDTILANVRAIVNEQPFPKTA